MLDLRVSLSTNDVRQLFLLSLLHQKAGTLSLLLCDLLVLNSLGELRSESEVSDGNVIEDNVEVLRASVQGLAAGR